ncbi:MAG: glycosyltransferase family 4 protein [Deltaproteobacteria bacterium]|nr:glycosyltransferase family 4 protein [Deltaproteobacteria bacterium]
MLAIGAIMRILYVAPNIRIPGTNGGATHVTEVTAALRRHGEVLVLARRGSSGPQVVPLGLGNPPVLQHVLPFAYLPAVVLRARAFRPDVIYERFSAFGLGALLKLACGVPLVTMVLEYQLSPLSLHLADRLVTTRPALLPERVQSRVVHVHWGANPERFRPDADGAAVRAKLGLGGAPVVGYTGAFYPWHGLRTLVDAARRLERRDVRFLLVGDGQVRGEVEALARAAGLGDRFVFPGRVPYDEIAAYVAACDVCVAAYEPALHEATARSGDLALDPLKIFEYLAAERAVVACDSRNLRDLFDEREHLRLVPPGDAVALAGVLSELLAKADEARAMARRGRERVLERYTWQRHADHLVRVFQECIEERGQASAPRSR